MAIVVLEQGPRNLVLLVTSDAVGQPVDVSALAYPCAGLTLQEVIPSIDAVGSLAGPSTTVWSIGAGSHQVCFKDFGGISDGDGDWTITLTAGTAVVSFTKIGTVHPNPN